MMMIYSSRTKPSSPRLVLALLLSLLVAFSSCFTPLFTHTTTSRHRTSATANYGQVYQSSSSEASTGNHDAIVIALTREEGKNEKLRAQLEEQLADQKVDIVELPCIAHADGPDYDKLADMLQGQHWDYVTITSPEAARVLASAWSKDKVLNPPPTVAAVGKATEETLTKFGIPVNFCPSRALAKVFIQEIPTKASSPDTPTTVLYPASVKAKDTLQNGLEERGFSVLRLNTYDTVTATWTQEQVEKAKKTKIVCVASPSSIKGWIKNSRTGSTDNILAACIGETSAQACRELGFREEQIFYPEKPGIPGWVDAVQDALRSLLQHSHVTTL